MINSHRADVALSEEENKLLLANPAQSANLGLSHTNAKLANNAQCAIRRSIKNAGRVATAGGRSLKELEIPKHGSSAENNIDILVRVERVHHFNSVENNTDVLFRHSNLS
jgi:hypothetical protein